MIASSNRASFLVSAGLMALALTTACGGEDGATGAPGPAGMDGKDGKDGKDGELGIDGAPGKDGADGAMGEPGMDGAMGEPGMDGAMGEPGMDGAMGAVGEPGMDGATPAVGVSAKLLGRHSTGTFDKGAAEIIAYDTETKRVFVVNSAAATVDVLDVRNPALPALVQTIAVSTAEPLKTLGSANSVAVAGGILAVAIEAAPKTDPGLVAFYDTDTLALLGTATVGALPDMLTFTPDGGKLLVANEGEPSDDYLVDPEGSVSIITVPAGLATPATVQSVSFAGLNGDAAALRAQGVRIFGLNATVAQDFEPEYISVSADGARAWVTLQENNALAIIDVAAGTVQKLVPLGYKNHSLIGNELDASDQDSAINIRSWPIFGMYQPDAIAAYQVAGRTFLVTANEGDVREWTGYAEPARLGSAGYVLDPTRFPDAATLKSNINLGRLNVTKATGDTDDDGDYDAIYAFGARSFSVWTDAGALIYDSGNELELRTAKRLPGNFNSTSTANNFDNRSDDKGPEPEAVTIGYVGGTPFAFIGLERVGGFMVYDLTLPEAPRFVSYVNTRDFSTTLPADLATAGDLAPECSVFIAAEQSPTGKPLLVTGNETSGTTAFFELEALYGAVP
jgi:DNA-binding beta-propeller fold protein YncE